MQTGPLTACITASPWPTRHRVVFGGSNRVFLNSVAPCACFGREKGACDLAPEASADLSDFRTSPLTPLQKGEEKSLAPRSHGGTSTS
jgi:hypothetical protein